MGLSAATEGRAGTRARHHPPRRRSGRRYARCRAGARDESPSCVLSADRRLHRGRALGCPGFIVLRFKGAARYLDVRGGGLTAAGAAWNYPHPSPGFEVLRDRVAVYAGPMDACTVGDEVVVPQPGGFYGGWGHVVGRRALQGRAGFDGLVGPVPAVPVRTRGGWPAGRHRRGRGGGSHGDAAPARARRVCGAASVSYTHLTLPTKA